MAEELRASRSQTEGFNFSFLELLDWMEKEEGIGCPALASTSPLEPGYVPPDFNFHLLKELWSEGGGSRGNPAVGLFVFTSGATVFILVLIMFLQWWFFLFHFLFSLHISPIIISGWSNEPILPPYSFIWSMVGWLPRSLRPPPHPEGLNSSFLVLQSNSCL